MPWLNLCQLPPEDRKTIYPLLRTLPPVRNPVLGRLSRDFRERLAGNRAALYPGGSSTKANQNSSMALTTALNWSRSTGFVM